MYILSCQSPAFIKFTSTRQGNGKIRLLKVHFGNWHFVWALLYHISHFGLPYHRLASTTGIYFSLFWRLGRLRPKCQGNLVSWWRLSFCFEEVHVFAVTFYGGERGRQAERPNVRANTLLFILMRVLISSWGPHLSLIISQSTIFKNHHIRGQDFNMWIYCVFG